MNKLIYAIGIAVAATFTTNTKILNHHSIQKSNKIKCTERTAEVAAPDTTQMRKENKLL